MLPCVPVPHHLLYCHGHPSGVITPLKRAVVPQDDGAMLIAVIIILMWISVVVQVVKIQI